MRDILRTSLLAVALFMVVSTPAEADDHVLSHTGYKALQILLDQAQHLTGYVVTYEAPQLVFLDDLTDVSEERFGSAPPNGERFYAHKKVSISVPYQTNEQGLVVDPEGLIRALVAAGNTDAYQFELVQSGPKEFHVIPKRIRDEKGTPIAYEPLLDTKIQIDPAPRTGGEFIKAICAQIERTRKFKIRLVDGPERALEHYHTTRGANNQTAREALSDLLHDIHPGLTWAFMCEPFRMCGLGIEYIRPPRVPPPPRPPPPPLPPGQLPPYAHRR